MKKLSILLLTFFISCDKATYTYPVKKDIVNAVYASGKIEYSEQFNITSISEGYLKKAFVSEGDSIFENDKLFQLDNDLQVIQVNEAQNNYQFTQNNFIPQIRQIEEQISIANQKKKLSEKNLLRHEELIKVNAVSKLDYDNALLIYQTDVSNISILEKSLIELKNNLNQKKENSLSALLIQKKNNSYSSLQSDSKGLVLNVYKKKGDLIKKGETIAKIGAGELIIILDVAEMDISKIHLNQTVFISLSTEKDKSYKGKITKIYPSFDGDSQSFKVEAKFIEEPKILLNNMQLQANIIIDKKKNVLVVPNSFILEGDSIELKKKSKKIKIKTGIKTQDWTEVVSGLSVNDEIKLNQ